MALRLLRVERFPTAKSAQQEKFVLEAYAPPPPPLVEAVEAEDAVAWILQIELAAPEQAPEDVIILKRYFPTMALYLQCKTFPWRHVAWCVALFTATRECTLKLKMGKG